MVRVQPPYCWPWVIMMHFRASPQGELGLERYRLKRMSQPTIQTSRDSPQAKSMSDPGGLDWRCVDKAPRQTNRFETYLPH
jgi:hypothetical protein